MQQELCDCNSDTILDTLHVHEETVTCNRSGYWYNYAVYTKNITCSLKSTIAITNQQVQKSMSQCEIKALSANSNSESRNMSLRMFSQFWSFQNHHSKHFIELLCNEYIINKSRYLKGWREVVLQKPELNWWLGVFQYAQHHDTEEPLVQVSRCYGKYIYGLVHWIAWFIPTECTAVTNELGCSTVSNLLSCLGGKGRFFRAYSWIHWFSINWCYWCVSQNSALIIVTMQYDLYF